MFRLISELSPFEPVPTLSLKQVLLYILNVIAAELELPYVKAMQARVLW